MNKKILLILTTILIFVAQPVYAVETDVRIENLEDGSRYVTIIEDVSSDDIQLFSTKTATKSKTTYYETASGERMWYVKVTGTFTYGNGTSECTSATSSAKSLNNAWKTSNVSSSKSGNKASATATGKQYYNNRLLTSITKTVTLSCSTTGVFS